MHSDPMRWSSAMDEALQKLSEANICLGDLVLVAMARVVRVAEDAVSVARQRAESSSDTSTILAFHIKALSASLQQVKTSLSAEVLGNG